MNMKRKEIFIIMIFALGAGAVAYLILAAISFAAMLDGGGSGVILETMKSPYIYIPIFIAAVSTMLTWGPFKRVFES